MFKNNLLSAAVPVLLMFHAGGFIFGDPSLLDNTANMAEKRGFKAVQVKYPLGNPNKALRVARKTAKKYRHRTVCAYGESAGGALAGRLAQSGLVEGAAAYSPLVSTTTFLDGMFAETGDRVDLLPRSSKVRVKALRAAKDNPAFARDIKRWGLSDRKVKVRRVPGDHLGSTGEHDSNARLLLRFLKRRC